MPFEARPEPIDECARGPETRELHDGARPQLNPRPERHPFKLQAYRGDVLAELSRTYVVALRPQRLEKLGRDKMHLAQIGQARLPSGEIPVFDESAGVRIPLNAMALDEQNTLLRDLAEMVPTMGRYRQDAAFQREIWHRRIRLPAQKTGAFDEGIA
ncbi:hypothetical protein JIR23_21650 [Bradyrhizobium diazoefficiens]|nr:hypothetical protein JIR23_21650 [Bradyrhizobium diazoefficiens]